MDGGSALDEGGGSCVRVGLPRRQYDDFDHPSGGPRRRRCGEESEVSPEAGDELKREGQSMRTRLMGVVVAVGLLLAAVPVWAHHAFAAEFDQDKPITVQGIVTKWELTNPHSWIYIDVKGADGKAVTWMIEGASPNNL